MAYTAVPTVSTDDEWSAANHNLYIRDNLAQLAMLRRELELTNSYPPISDVNPAPLSFPESSGAAPNPAWPILSFDDTTDEGRQWTFIADRRYETAPVLKIHYYMAGANTSDAVVFVAQMACISDGDASATAKVFDSSNTSTTTVPDAAGTEDVASITMTNADSIAAGDRVILLLYRDADNGADTATGDCQVTGVELQYTA